MNTKVIWGIIIVIVVLGAGYFAYASMHPATSAVAPAMTDTTATPSNTMTATTTTTSDTSATTPTAATAKSVTITYTDQGFSPASVSIAAGTSVTFVNKSSERMWVASDPHPVHTGYDGTSVQQHCASNAPKGTNVFDECTAVANGGTFTFMPTKIGTWGYHNHANHDMTGSLTVTAPVTTTTTTTTVHASL